MAFWHQIIMADENVTPGFHVLYRKGTPMLAYPGGSREEMLQNWQIVRDEQQAAKTPLK